MSTRWMRSNQRVLLASRRATIAITVAAVGFGAGSSLAQAADEAPTPTSTQVTTQERLVIELMIEGPPEAIAAPPADDRADGDGAPVDTSATTEPPPAPDSLSEPAPDPEPPATALETTTTTSPTDAGHDHEDGGGGHEEGAGGHEDASGGGHEEGGGGHEGGHEGGGSGGQGQGTPYRVTLSVDWRSEAGTPIAVIDDVLPADWRALFELTAASRTGRNRPTSAVCAYEGSGDQLVCEFENPGHRSDAQGMIVPARPTATYTVTVSWVPAGWTIDGANAGPYSARDLCPRGDHGTGHVGGHGGGHDTLTDAVGADASPSGGTFPCAHIVVIQQLPVVVPEPEPEPEPPVPPAEPAAPGADETRAALPPVAPAAMTTPQALPATGSSISMMLAIGTALAAIGVGLALLARRATPDPIGSPVRDRGRMPA
jgi:hypothetical protein